MRRIVRHHSTLGALDKMRRFLPIAGIERHDQIGVAEYFLVAAQIERMAIGKIEPRMDIEYGGADGLGQRQPKPLAPRATYSAISTGWFATRRRSASAASAAGSAAIGAGTLLCEVCGSAMSRASGCSCSQAS